MKKRDGHIDARPWLVIRALDGRAEVHFDRGEPGLVILEGGRYWHELDAQTHRDRFNRERDEVEATVAKTQGELFA